MTERERFVEYCLDQERAGAVYIWNHDGQRVRMPDGRMVPSFDCSGLVVSGYRALGLPDWRRTHNCQRLWKDLEPIATPQRGDLVLYGRNTTSITHVAVYLGPGIIEAGGGDSDTTTVARAMQRNARVRQRPTPHYRNDVRGYRRSPLDVLPAGPRLGAPR